MAIKYDERLVKVSQLKDGMILVLNNELVVIEDLVEQVNSTLVDIKLKGQWDFFDGWGTVTIAENIREEADEQPEEPAGE